MISQPPLLSFSLACFNWESRPRHENTKLEARKTIAGNSFLLPLFFFFYLISCREDLLLGFQKSQTKENPNLTKMIFEKSFKMALLGLFWGLFEVSSDIFLLNYFSCWDDWGRKSRKVNKSIAFSLWFPSFFFAFCQFHLESCRDFAVKYKLGFFHSLEVCFLLNGVLPFLLERLR